MDSTRPGINYGPHLLADLAGCPKAKMRDGEFVYRFLKNLVVHVGMNPIGSPHLDLYTGPHREWEGWSATVHIQTSHITAHLFAFGYAFLDVFSCKPFCLETTKDYILRELEPEGTVRFQLIGRGENFPRQLIDPSQLLAAGPDFKKVGS